MADDVPAGPPKQRGSIRAVTIEGDPKTYMCEVRTMPGFGLRTDDIIWVEFGATWPEINGVKTRLPGQWRQCVVLPGNSATSADVHVRLSPSTDKAPPAFG